ncbi:MAG TPA: L-dopachrome tautomerase-related protein [Tepidisphaeraceae bacterium]|jgi:sugar lactone lactonase YvrE
MLRFITTLISAAVLLVFTANGCGVAGGDQPRVQTSGPGGRLDDSHLAQTAAARIEQSGSLESAALLYGPMPTGVAVSHNGRLFVCFPRWGDPVEFTVAEIKEGRVAAFPNADINKLRSDDPANCLLSVQSVVVDDMDRLWILDTGSVNTGPTVPHGPKMLCVDLRNNQIVKRIEFPQTVALTTSYLNDVCFDLDHGREGMAFITDSSDQGPNGIVVVDLASGASWRKLNDHPSTKADPNFVPIVEAEPLMVRPPAGQPPAYLKIGSDGIAIDTRSRILYYCPLASRRLYHVSVDALADPNLSDNDVARTVEQMPERDFASDGLLCDHSRGTLYLTDYEHNAIRRFAPDQKRYEIIVSDRRIIWPDSMAITADDSTLFFTANQLNRQPRFHGGKDRRQQPYAVFRTNVATGPVAALNDR